MSYRPKILAFAGSTRKDSFNKKLVAVVAQAARAAGADVNLIDLQGLDCPSMTETMRQPTAFRQCQETEAVVSRP